MPISVKKIAKLAGGAALAAAAGAAMLGSAGCASQQSGACPRPPVYDTPCQTCCKGMAPCAAPCPDACPPAPRRPHGTCKGMNKCRAHHGK